MLKVSTLTAKLLALAAGLTLNACAEPEVIVAGDLADTDYSGMAHDEPVRDPAKDDSDSAHPGAWDWYNAPERIEEGLERNYARLPKYGTADRTPWTDTYWPKNKGGIRKRWIQGWTGGLPTAQELASMTLESVRD